MRIRETCYSINQSKTWTWRPAFDAICAETHCALEKEMKGMRQNWVVSQWLMLEVTSHDMIVDLPCTCIEPYHLGAFTIINTSSDHRSGYGSTAVFWVSPNLRNQINIVFQSETLLLHYIYNEKTSIFSILYIPNQSFAVNHSTAALKAPSFPALTLGLVISPRTLKPCSHPSKYSRL